MLVPNVVDLHFPHAVWQWQYVVTQYTQHIGYAPVMQQIVETVE